MESIPLDQLTPKDVLASIEILVLRKWEYRGNTDTGPIQHVGMIFVDKQRNTIYAEIPGDLAEEKSNMFKKGDTYHVTRFKTGNLKKRFRPVQASFMIYITDHTRATPWDTELDDFPNYAYNLTPLNQLESKIGDTTYLIDVLGIITEVSYMKAAQHSSSLDTGYNRDVLIRDHWNNQLKITLWGNKATEFSVHHVYNDKEQKPIVVLFVGCIIKRFQNETYLNGNASCDWYFNPDIEEANSYYTAFADQRIPLQLPNPQLDIPPEAEIVFPECKTVSELLAADPYSLVDHQFQCTVTITSVPNTTRWWFPACTKCNRSATEEGSTYICYPCNWKNHTFRYKLRFVGSDETGQTELFCFDNVARHIVGRPCEAIIRLSPITGNNTLPPEIAAIVGLKYTFIVTLNRPSVHLRNRVFQIMSIFDFHGRQQNLPNVPPNGDNQYPRTPTKLLTPPSTHLSPSSAMRRLSTASPKNDMGTTSNLPQKSTKEHSEIPHEEHRENKDHSTIVHDKTSSADVEPVGSPPKKIKHVHAKTDASTSASASAITKEKRS